MTCLPLSGKLPFHDSTLALITIQGSFLPITLEQLARERGVLRSDGVTSCIAKPRNPVARQETARLWSSLFSRDLVKRESLPCVIHLFGTDINTSSFTLYTFSLATLCQAFALVSLSAIADHGMPCCSIVSM